MEKSTLKLAFVAIMLIIASAGWVRRLDGCCEWVGFIAAVWGGFWVGFADVVPRPKAAWVMLGTSWQWVEEGREPIGGRGDGREPICFNTDKAGPEIFKPSKLPANADFHLFKAGIEPKWEDLECAGGKWSVISSRKANLDTMWLETVKF
uniref:Eukaryotic translation initiation factor isoform 4E n=1 Tax=Fagus sylvatica TaxID=28930 RepID=A0A2N9IM97_FAGSY